jgi:hypothetical protein
VLRLGDENAIAKVIDRAVYGTIAVTSVLIVFDGWANLGTGGAVAVILGPIVAMVVGHIYAASVAAYPKLRGQVALGDLRVVAQRESLFVLVCAPQLFLLLVLRLAGLGLPDTIRVLIWVGPVALGLLGGVAAWRAGSRAPGVVLGVFIGLAVGALVLLLQVFLQPGAAVSNGVAAVTTPITDNIW